jgi:ribosomal protein S14
MNEETKTFPKHACQFCGCERKFVETLIDDEFFWNDIEQMYQPNKFMDDFEHTGNNRCAECGQEWSGL